MNLVSSCSSLCVLLKSELMCALSSSLTLPSPPNDLLLPFVRSCTMPIGKVSNNIHFEQLHAHLLLEQMELPLQVVLHKTVVEPLSRAISIRYLLLTDLVLLSHSATEVAALLSSLSHPQRIRRLHVQNNNCIAQTVLDRYTSLVELRIDRCTAIKTVHFCCETLRCLYANETKLNDEGLSQCKRLEVLHVHRCVHVTTVEPFAATLRELDASFGCGISDNGLASATRIAHLNVQCNSRITTVKPFASTLRCLRVSHNAMRDEGLQDATNLVSLELLHAPLVTTIAPFATSLRELHLANAPLHYGTGDASGIVKLYIQGRTTIDTVKSFAATLRGLHVIGKETMLGDEGLAEAHALVRLEVLQNDKITTVAPFRETLCELSAGKTSALVVSAETEMVEYRRNILITKY